MMVTTPFIFLVSVFGSSLAAGAFGSMLGIGGGMLLVPLLTLGFGVDIRFAVGASIVSVIATSSGAAAAFLRERLTNVRTAIFLETATATGAIVGGLSAGFLTERVIFGLFAIALAAAAVTMVKKLTHPEDDEAPRSALADRLELHGSYYDPEEGREVPYRVARPLTGLGLMFVAGMSSGVLGIGSGALKVPALDLAMRLPLKVSTATSSFMIGVTAAASAAVYFSRGDIDPFLAGPVCAGVLVGAYLGARLLPRAKTRTLRSEARGRAMTMAGLLVLIMPPVLRLVIAHWAFRARGDAMFARITISVLALLVASIAMGLAT